VVAKVREKLAVSNQTAQNFDMVKYNLSKLSDLEDRKEYQVKVSNGLQL
jgi:hypothetical protein